MRCTTRRSGSSRAVTSRAPRTRPRRTGSSRGVPGSVSSRAGRARRRRPSGCTPRSRTRRRCCSSSARCRVRFAAARPGRSSTTRRSSAASRRPPGRSRARSGSRSTWPRRSRSRSPDDPGPSCSRSRGRARGTGRGRGRRPVVPSRQSPGTDDLARLRELLAAAERPLVVVGEGGWTAETSRDVQAFCEANSLPVACAFRCQDFVDNRSPSYVGVLGVAMDEAHRRRGSATQISYSRSEAGSARCRRAGTRFSSRPIHGRRSSTSIPIRASSAVSICRTWRLRRRSPRRRPRSERSSRSSRAGRSGRQPRVPTYEANLVPRADGG